MSYVAQAWRWPPSKLLPALAIVQLCHVSQVSYVERNARLILLATCRCFAAISRRAQAIPW